MGQTGCSEAHAALSSAPRKNRPKPGQRQREPFSWKRMPKRQRARIVRIFMFVFLAIFVLSLAGGLMLIGRAPVQPANQTAATTTP